MNIAVSQSATDIVNLKLKLKLQRIGTVEQKHEKHEKLNLFR